MTPGITLHTHHHASEGAAPAWRHLRALVIAIAVATLLAGAMLWPRGQGPDSIKAVGIVEVDATVDTVDNGRCPSVEVQGADTDCQLITATVTGGPTKGEPAYLETRAIDFDVPALHVGDRVVLRYTASAPAPYQYTFSDFQRSTPLWTLAAIFAIVVLAIGRGLGARALLGLMASLAVIVMFALPSLLRANNALAVALVTTVAIAFIALYVAHGINSATTVALLGTLASLIAIVALAALFIWWARLTGLSDESAQVLRVTASSVDPRGLLLAGTVIGALGVLDDITVTQVAAVLELRGANPDLDASTLYRRAIRIGRDHIASTVNTLILAYVGASLPLLLYFTQAGQSTGRVATREVVAAEIVRTLAGSIGLVLAMPVTTALAVRLLQPTSGHHTIDDLVTPLPSWDDFTREH